MNGDPESLPEKSPADSTTVHYTQTGKFKMPREEPLVLKNPGDWLRIQKSIARLGEPLTAYAMNWSATALGTGIGLVATVISLKATDSHPRPGVVAGLYIAIVFSFLFALCFFLVGKREKERHHITALGIGEDMDDVVIRAERSDLVPPKGTPKPRLWRRLSSKQDGGND